MKQFTFTDPSTGFLATLSVVENGDGTLSVTIDVDESTGATGDVRAIYFNNTGDQNLAGLTATPGETDGDAATSSDTDDIALRQDINKVRWVESKDTNVNGQVINENDGAFDTGLEFGSQGIGNDDVQHMEFTLSADDPLTLDSFDFSTVGFRVTSVGDVDGSRNGSLKLSGEEVIPPPVDSTLVALNDYGIANIEVITGGEVDTVVDPFDLGSAISWVVNDSDPDGDSFELISVSGANGTSDTDADGDDWFGWVDGDVGGEIRLNGVTGEVQIRDFDGELFSFDQTSISYTIEDSTGVTATAVVTVELFEFD